jgi:hypothetical protein
MNIKLHTIFISIVAEIVKQVLVLSWQVYISSDAVFIKEFLTQKSRA